MCQPSLIFLKIAGYVPLNTAEAFSQGVCNAQNVHGPPCICGKVDGRPFLPQCTRLLEYSDGYADLWPKGIPFIMLAIYKLNLLTSFDTFQSCKWSAHVSAGIGNMVCVLACLVQRHRNSQTSNTSSHHHN